MRRGATQFFAREATLELILGWPGDIRPSRLADVAAPQGYEERSRRMTRHLESIVSKFKLASNQRSRTERTGELLQIRRACVCVNECATIS